MVTGVALVRGQIDGPINVDRQIGVHLDDAAIIALVPIVTAPRFIGDVFNCEIFVRRQLDVRECAFATRLDRELKDSVQFVFWNHERPAPVLVTLQERSLTRKFRFELGEDFLEMRFKKPGCNGVIQGLRLFIEFQTFAFQDPHSCLERG